MTEQKDILVAMADEDHVFVNRPATTDSSEVVDLKLFLLACIHRRAKDEEFDLQMKLWMSKKVQH